MHEKSDLILVRWDGLSGEFSAILGSFRGQKKVLQQFQIVGIQNESFCNLNDFGLRKQRYFHHKPV